MATDTPRTTVAVPSVPLITIFVPHSVGCPNSDDSFYKRCKCRKSLRYFHNGKQRMISAKTRTWKIAEDAKRDLENKFRGADPENEIEDVCIKAETKTTIERAVELFVSDKKSQGLDDGIDEAIIASKHQEAIEGIIVQNGNAYVEGIGAAFDPMKPFWTDRNAETEKPVRDLLKKETTIFQYTHGTKDPSRISPDSYTVDQFFLDRPGNHAIQLNLLHNYQSNLALYDGWHEFFRNKQPKTLIVWGKNDPFFKVQGAQAYLRDIPKAELHLLDTGHFALEDSSEFIAQQIIRFFA